LSGVSGTDPKVSLVSKPFIVSAVVFVSAGSIVGSFWMMSVLGLNVLQLKEESLVHRTFQIDGFLTLLVMGVGYMIVPRFRNILLPSKNIAYISYLLILCSILMSIASSINIYNYSFYIVSRITHLSGVIVFGTMMLSMLRIRPRLLRTADYFIGLSTITLIITDIIEVLRNLSNASQLGELQVLLLFAILMIFGIELKTLPSFLGFIRPARKLIMTSLSFAIATALIGFATIIYDSNHTLVIIFNLMLLGCAISFAKSVFIFGGFDNTGILPLMQGEKKARYIYTTRHLRLAFIFLYAGIASAVAFITIDNSYTLYDLAIHYTAIGFIGITIALYLPMMLPPITGRIVHFTSFNNIPIILIVSGLMMRTFGDLIIMTNLATGLTNYIAISSGWLIVSAILAFIIMIHNSMKEITRR
jgi:hypothetical protein